MVHLFRRRSWLVMALVLLASPSLAQQPRAARSQQSSLPSSVSSSSARRATAATSSSPAGETSNGWGRAPAAAQGNSNRRRPSDGRRIVPLGRAPASSSVSSLPSAAWSSQQPRPSSPDRPASSSSSASRTPSVTRRSVPSPGAAGQLQGPPSSSNGTPRRDSTSAPPAGRRVPLRPRRGSQAAAPSVPSPESSPSLTLPQGLSSGAAGTPPATRSSPRSTSDARNANGLPLRWMSEQQNSSRVEEPPQKQGNPTAPKQGNPTAPKQGSPTAPGQDEGRNKADARPTPISSTAEQLRAPTGAALQKLPNNEAAAEAAPEDAIGNKAADNDGGRTYEADPADTRFPRSVRFRVPEPRAAQDTSSSSSSASRINNASSSPLQPMTSADPDASSNWQCDSAYTAIESFDFLSNLRKALDAADMAEPLMDPTIPITFLAPTNQVRTIAAGRTATGDLLEPFEL